MATVSITAMTRFVLGNVRGMAGGRVGCAVIVTGQRRIPPVITQRLTTERTMLDRRNIPGLAAAMAVVAASFRPAHAQLAAPTPGMMTAQDCIDSCWRSHSTCLTTIRYCLEKGGMHAMPAHLALLADCAELCQATANSLLRRSPQHAAICTACAVVCDACAQECEGFRDDERVATCARTCRTCADHCRDMSRMPV